MKKINLLAFITLIAFVSVQAVELDYSALVNADVGLTTSDIGKDASYETNQEIDLTFDVAINDALSVQVYTTIITGATPFGGALPQDRWGDVAFDGVTISWSNINWDWYLIDLVYQGGAYNYYRYDRTSSYSTVIPETFIRGFGFDYVEGLSVYTGITDAPNRLVSDASVSPKLATYVSYEFQVGSLVLNPMADVALAGDTQDSTIKEDKSIDYHLGGTANLELGVLKLNVDIGGGREYNKAKYFSVTSGVSIDFSEKFAIGAVFNLNTLDTITYNYLPEKTFVVLSSVIKLSENLNLVPHLEYHKLYSDNTVFSFVPAVHIIASENVEIIPRLGFNFGDVGKENIETSFADKYFLNVEFAAAF